MSYNTDLLDGMVIFAEVVNAGSFTRAADHTGHSTSYISKEIHRLEQRLGVRLMNRTTRTQHLTAEGELFYQRCQQILTDANEVQQALLGLQQQPSGNLKISCPYSLGITRLQPLFAGYLCQHPEVTLDVDMNNRKVDVIADGFDIVIRATSQLEDSSLISRCIMHSRSVTVAAPSYLAKQGTPQHPNELRQHHCLTYSNLKYPRLWQYKNQYGMDIEVEVNSRMSINSSEVELAMCCAGLGIARMPEFVLDDQLQSGKLVELFTDYQTIPIDIYLIYPSRKHMSAKVRSFIDYVAEALS
ncbi:LysR family transcriptional regulator [Bacterioplanes sanyensis]|uniref:LysR family transcriptional regulator n=1 Tax=Bacterioplanes sanyensis TaxID=1249553 RepID=A0A222FG81_9GAMM|nr:LysR family transcriptional regulator [Bacterioplanes sanyensis]ASP37596.1 LysR family transcriptional regulator [Bacterioplanes sanyensis]